MKVIFTCGGTAGHVNPALALAGYMREKDAGTQILFVGAERGLERDLIAHTDYPFRTVNISSFHRSFKPAEIKHNLVSLKNLAHAEREANAILNDFHPDLIVGTGGYASYPLVRYGAKAGIPTAVHESNIVPGLTTRQLEPHCDRIMVGFEDCRAHYKHPEKVVVTGTPVRGDFFTISKQQAKEKLGMNDGRKLIVSFWGSLGSNAMNRAMAEFLALESAKEPFYHIHGVGEICWKPMQQWMHDDGLEITEHPALDVREYIYDNGYVKNKVMEFVGPGVANLSADYRNGIDVMTTETTCWSSIWQTDDTTKEYFVQHGRPEAYKELKPADVAYYDGCIELDLSTVECMIALPMHPSYAYPIRELKANAKEILQAAQDQANRQLGGKVEMDLVGKICDDGRIYVDQGVVAGCSGGTYENICAVADIIKGKSCGNGEFKFSVYPDSMPTYLELVKNGAVADIVSAGGIFRECFCGPCFGAGDTPANGEFSIRHTTRNFPNREGSKPGEGQISAVALMDARSIAATAANGGYLTAASELTDVEYTVPDYHFEQGVYDKRVYNGWGHPEPDYALKFGPNIKDWPEQPALTDDLLVKIVSYITDPVTTPDELIPSGETSSFRSNPLRLAEFTLSRKDPAYVPNAKAVKALDEQRKAGELPAEVARVYDDLKKLGYAPDAANTNIGSAIFANKPGDGSAREQAASCQRVLGGAANFACEYATKRYRSNCINWGMLPFLLDTPNVLDNGDYVYLPGIRKALLEAADEMTAIAVKPDGGLVEFRVRLGAMTDAERQILADGCLINYYKNH